MKEVYAITERHKEGQKYRHVLFGIDKNDLSSAIMLTEARQKINWDRTAIWGLLCTEETFEYIKIHLVFGGFDPYGIEGVTEIHLKKMADMHFYKEIQMI